MKRQLRLLATATLLLLGGPVSAAVLWVGQSPNCVGSNVYSNLAQALLVAGFNADSSNEIRLTNTITYWGNTNGTYRLTDWTPGGAGRLTLAGGYSDCFVPSPSILTDIGRTANPIFTIDTGAQSFSEVTLKNLLLNSSEDRAIIARSGAFVSLENVLILGNNGGLAVEANATVEIDAASPIRFNGGGVNVNGFIGDVARGGGIHCSGVNASVRSAASMYFNGALEAGGHIYVGDGCFVELLNGVRIRGSNNPAPDETAPLDTDAPEGGGIYVDVGGQLQVKGRANRVIIHDLKADNGGGLYVNGGLALLENAHFDTNEAVEGAAITVVNGGDLFMDRSAECGLGGLRCSEIQNSRHQGTVIHVADAFAQIQRTMIERSTQVAPIQSLDGLVTSFAGSTVRLNRVGFVDNESNNVLMAVTAASSGAPDAIMQASHLTVAKNFSSQFDRNAAIFTDSGSRSNFTIENSIVADSWGADTRSGRDFAGRCNLIDNATNWPVGSYRLGAPDFVNIAGNDPHQLPESDGVDMCLQDSFAWSTDFDIDMQSAPVNEMTNPQGLPGEDNGLFDAGFDEVYANVGEDEFTLTIEKQGSGDGSIVSVPSGIGCGSDCEEVYFNGTIVTLNAVPAAGSTFVGWSNCPLVNQQDQCQVQMTTNRTIRAEFSAAGVGGESIFSDGFE